MKIGKEKYSEEKKRPEQGWHARNSDTLGQKKSGIQPGKYCIPESSCPMAKR